MPIQNRKSNNARGGGGHSSLATTANPVPVFLRKVYELIDTCDPSVATWSDDGLSFVFKDIDRLESEVIPQYFKHNHLSSLVRQLNLYGFHKLRTEPIRLNDTEREDSQHLRFYHDCFRRGQPELLVNAAQQLQESRKAGQPEVDDLKDEIASLRGWVQDTGREIDGLKVRMRRGLDRQAAQDQATRTEEQPPVSKKLKTMHLTNSSLESSIREGFSRPEEPYATESPGDNNIRLERNSPMPRPLSYKNIPLVSNTCSSSTDNRYGSSLGGIQVSQPPQDDAVLESLLEAEPQH